MFVQDAAIEKGTERERERERAPMRACVCQIRLCVCVSDTHRESCALRVGTALSEQVSNDDDS